MKNLNIIIISLLLLIILTLGFYLYRMNNDTNFYKTFYNESNLENRIYKEIKKEIKKEEFIAVAEQLNINDSERGLLLQPGSINFIEMDSQRPEDLFNLDKKWISVTYYNGSITTNSHEYDSKASRQDALNCSMYYDQAMTLKKLVKKNTFKNGYNLVYPNGFVITHFKKGSVKYWVDTNSNEWKSNTYKKYDFVTFLCESTRFK